MFPAAPAPPFPLPSLPLQCESKVEQEWFVASLQKRNLRQEDKNKVVFFKNWKTQCQLFLLILKTKNFINFFFTVIKVLHWHVLRLCDIKTRGCGRELWWMRGGEGWGRRRRVERWRNKWRLMCPYYSNLCAPVQCKHHGRTDHYFNQRPINSHSVPASAVRHLVEFELIKSK